MRRSSRGRSLGASTYKSLYREWVAIPFSVKGSTVPKRFVAQVIHYDDSGFTVAWFNPKHGRPTTYATKPSGFEVLSGCPQIDIMPYEMAPQSARKAGPDDAEEEARRTNRRRSTEQEGRLRKCCIFFRRCSLLLVQRKLWTDFNNQLGKRSPFGQMVEAVALFDGCNESLELAARYVGILLREWPMSEMVHTDQLQVLTSKSSSAHKHVDEEPAHLKVLTRRLLPSLETLAKVLFISLCSLCGLSCSTLPQCPLSPRHPAPHRLSGKSTLLWSGRMLASQAWLLL